MGVKNNWGSNIFGDHKCLGDLKFVGGKQICGIKNLQCQQTLGVRNRKGLDFALVPILRINEIRKNLISPDCLKKD